MIKQPNNPISKDIQSAFYDQARLQEEAFSILHRAVLRYQATGRLLDKQELARILPHERHLVLNTDEQWLLYASQTARRTAPANRWSRMRILSLFFCGFLLFTVSGKPVERGHAASPAAPVPAEPERAATLFTSPSKPLKTSNLPSVSKKAVKAALPAEAEEATLIEEEELPAPVVEEVAASEPESKAEVTQPLRISLGRGFYRFSPDGKKWGLVRPSGRKILPAVYDRITRFQPGKNLFLIERDGRAGIADANGEVLLHPFFEKVTSYFPQEGLCVVANEGRQGVYDLKTDQFALGLRFDEVCCFSEGLFGVRYDNGRWGFVDRNGRAIIPATYDAIVEPFQHGRARVRVREEEFYIDLAGSEIAATKGAAERNPNLLPQ